MEEQLFRSLTSKARLDLGRRLVGYAGFEVCDHHRKFPVQPDHVYNFQNHSFYDPSGIHLRNSKLPILEVADRQKSAKLEDQIQP
jgi:hypothetical protein